MDETSWGETFPDTPHDAPHSELMHGTGQHPLVVVSFTPPETVQSINKTSRMNYHARHKYQQRWKAAAQDACVLAADALTPFRGYRVFIEAVLPVSKQADSQGDLSNYGWAADPLKYALDGVTASHLVVPDDKAVWVQPGNVWFDTKPDALVRLRLTCADQLHIGPPF